MSQRPSQLVSTPQPGTTLSPKEESGTRLTGPVATLAQAGWLAITLPTLALFAAALPLRYSQLAHETEPLRATIDGIDILAAMTLGIEILFVACSCAVAALIFWRKSTDWLALLVALFLIVFSATFPPELDLLAAQQPLLAPFTIFLAALTYISLNGLGYLFPTGQFVPRWTWLALLLVALLEVPFNAPENSPISTAHWPALLFLLVALSEFLLPVLTQLYRYRRVSTLEQRQQTKWVVYGVGVSLLMAVVLRGLIGLSPAVAQNSGFNIVATEPAFDSIFLLVLIGIPLSFGVAILRYRLWDIDLLINRTLVYGGLSLSIAVVYVLIVGGLGALFQSQGNLLISLLATVVVALLFQTWRTRLQRGVNRLLYGQRDEPYQVLAHLGQRLQSTLAPDAALEAITETIAQALKLPYVALRPSDTESNEPIASYGTLLGAPFDLPLVHQGATVGHMLLGARARGESLTPADQRLLADLLPQVGLAMYAARLTADLQQLTIDLQHSRERLVSAREEERRRLRRDLHDGLGPQLASQNLTLTAASKLLRQDPNATEALLLDARHHAQEAIVDIRRVINALRPASLDVLGLVGALREQAANFQASDLQITIEAPATLLPLPAATEVACFRITQEALTNVVRHAKAHTCLIILRIEDGLVLEITDDGCGIPVEHRIGVGLASMRERAAEVGGTCLIESTPDGGTRIHARLPLE